MPLRLWIEAILSVPLDDRLEDHPVVMSVTLREFLSWLYPGERQPRPSEYWPALNKAILALDSVDARIPWEDPLTGRGGLRRVVSVGDIPRGPGKLDDLITVIVHLPPGSGVGPVIDRQRLRFWGTRSAPAYRAMLGLAYRWFDPGKTRIPLENGRYWHQSDRPQDYDKLTEKELLTLCFPTSQQKSRRLLLQRANKVIQNLAEAGDIRNINGHILPPKKPTE